LQIVLKLRQLAQNQRKRLGILCGLPVFGLEALFDAGETQRDAAELFTKSAEATFPQGPLQDRASG
jgi:hypothetical protein